MSRWAFAAVLVLMSSTGCKKPPPKTATTYSALTDPRDAVRGLLEAAYDALEAHDTDKFNLLLAPDAMVYGLGPSETFNFREPALEAIRQAWADGRPDVSITEGRMPVGLAVGGQSAWLWDFPRVEMGAGVYLPRVTAHAIRDHGAWRFDAIHLSLGVTDEKLYAPDAQKKFIAPADVVSEHNGDSDVLIEQTKHLLEDLAFKVTRTGDGADVVLLGTDPSEVFEGGQSFKAMVKPRLAEIKKAVFEYRVESPFRARVAPDGRTGWVAANVSLRIGSGKKAVTLPVFRTLWVYEKEAGEWNMVLEHQSLAVSDEQREEATADQLKARDVREQKKVPLAPKVREASDGGFGTFE